MYYFIQNCFFDFKSCPKNMEFEFISLIFIYVAVSILILSFAHQIYTVYKFKSAEELSYPFLFLQLLGNVLFTVYNSMHRAYPVIAGESIICLLVIFIIMQKYFYDLKEKNRMDTYL